VEILRALDAFSKTVAGGIDTGNGKKGFVFCMLQQMCLSDIPATNFPPES
jgi:hypothetical protein